MTTIEVREVTRSFGRAGIVGVSFGCRPGSITAFLGPNGAGKTTTMRVMAGLLEPTSGDVRYDGRRLTELERPARAVSFVFGPQSLPQAYSADAFLGRVAMAEGLAASAAREALVSVGLGSWGRKRIGRLSLGMRQRLAIGAATMGRPGALVLDEPFNGLDPEGIEWLRDLMTGLRDAGTTVLVSTHLLREVESCTDHVVVIRDGRVQADTTTAVVAGPRSRCTTADPAALAAVLAAAGVGHEPDGDGLVVALEVTDLLRLCNHHRIDLDSVEPHLTRTLEAAYEGGGR